MRQVFNEGNDNAISSGLLVLRIVTGIAFFMHGWQKLVDYGLSATQGSFEAMGVPMAETAAVVATFIELVGGAMLIAGVLTRIVGLVLAIEMAAALFTVHLGNGFFIGTNGIELVLVLGGAALALAITGPGRYAVDAFIPAPGASREASYPGEPRTA